VRATLTRTIYYALKPLLPWPVRLAARRFVAQRTRRNHAATWPIDEAAGRPPANWPGWPDGRKFALVLTHDVEGSKGLANCRKLAELEMEMGFRSSFNFIPEGEYTLPAELRQWLVGNGFEVGVHDLHHDGRLFWSRRRFVHNSKKINGYLHNWGAVGFRAGFMLRQLDWYHDLNIDYDASTFDTDPFEPQPDGAGTIFPFWVGRPPGAGAGSLNKDERSGAVSSILPLPSSTGDKRRAGYVELPYTLSQDSTLFLVLRETTSEIWLRKLAWVAGKGGMAMVNVHPDYLAFAGDSPKNTSFPASYYRDLLRHVRDDYSGAYWPALPREVANFASQNLSAASAPRPASAPSTPDPRS
jgi:hypothetical protein